MSNESSIETPIRAELTRSDTTDWSRHVGILIEQLPVILYTVDRDLCFRSSCGKGLKTLKVQPGQMRGMSLHDYFGSKDPNYPPIKAHHDTLQGQHVDFNFSWQNQTYHTHLEPLRDDDGQIVGVIGLAQDISERAMLEDQLRQSQKMEAIGRLAGGIAHDFNNLLTAIMGCGEMLLDSFPKTDPMRGTAEQIMKASGRAAVLTRQLLAFSRRQILQPKCWNLNTTIMEMEQLLRRLLGEPVAMSIKLGLHLKLVMVDPGQIELVLLNLSVNARDAMPLGGQLEIETLNVDEAERKGVELVVRDTGVGMSPEVRSHIFEPFFTTKEPGKGTGLGLSTVYGIVQQSGGEINVSSAPGSGAEFRIFFPEAKGQSSSSSSASSRKSIPVTGGSETVLLVEDEELVRDWIKKVLQRRGYQVLEAQDGWEGEKAATNFTGSIDLLLTDVVMPHLGGIELSTRLLKTRPAMRCLFISGYMEHVSLSSGTLDAQTNFMQKPFTPDALLARVRQILDLKRA